MRYPTHADWEQARDADQHSKVRELLPRLDWHALWENEEEEEWLLYPLVAARRLTAIFSAAGAGKSLLMLELAAGLSTGKKVLGRVSDRRIRVLYIDFENDPRGDVRTRLQDMGYEPGELDYLDYLSFPSLSYLDSAIGASELLAAVEAYAPELVVIDTISRAVKGEENDNDTWLNFYKHTGLAMKKAQVAVVRLDHTGKDQTKGERGGSAKRGDIDASWLLTETVKNKRYRLECLKHRFQLGQTDMALARHEFPLHHTVEDIGIEGGEREVKIRELIKEADHDKLSCEGRDKFVVWLKGRGLKASKDVSAEVVRRRKNRDGLTFDPVDNSSKPARNELGQVPETEPARSGGGSSRAGFSGNGKTPSETANNLPGNGSGSPGAGPTPEPAPSLSLYKRGAGEGPGQLEACSECGWDRFHKAACSKNPARKIEEMEG